jgi:hypothetical protein
VKKKTRLENALDWVTAEGEIDKACERELADIDERMIREQMGYPSDSKVRIFTSRRRQIVFRRFFFGHQRIFEGLSSFPR